MSMCHTHAIPYRVFGKTDAVGFLSVKKIFGDEKKCRLKISPKFSHVKSEE